MALLCQGEFTMEIQSSYRWFEIKQRKVSLLSELTKTWLQFSISWWSVLLDKQPSVTNHVLSASKTPLGWGSLCALGFSLDVCSALLLRYGWWVGCSLAPAFRLPREDPMTCAMWGVRRIGTPWLSCVSSGKEIIELGWCRTPCLYFTGIWVHNLLHSKSRAWLIRYVYNGP